MQISILLEPRFGEFDNGISIIANFGQVSVVDHHTKKLHNGKHVIIEGEEEKLRKWLKPYSPIWVCNDNLMLQQFKLYEVS